MPEGTFWLAANGMLLFCWLMILVESGKKFDYEFEASLSEAVACDAIEFMIAGWL